MPPFALFLYLSAMDFFSRVGAVEAAQGSFRARVRWKEDGQERQCRGPRRDYEQTAQEDLEILRETAAEHRSRKKGFKAIQAAAKRLRATQERCYRRRCVAGGTVALPFQS